MFLAAACLLSTCLQTCREAHVQRRVTRECAARKEDADESADRRKQKSETTEVSMRVKGLLCGCGHAWLWVAFGHVHVHVHFHVCEMPTCVRMRVSGEKKRIRCAIL